MFVELEDYSVADFSKKLNLSEEETFSRLSDVAIQGLASFKQSPSGALGDSLCSLKFVGLASFDGKLVRAVPKYFTSGDAASSDFEECLRVLYKQKSSQLALDRSDAFSRLPVGKHETSAAIYLIADYIENGEFPALTTSYSGLNEGEINWDRTIEQSSPILFDDSPVYLDLVYETQSVDSQLFCLRLYRCILSDCMRFLSQTALDRLLGLSCIPLTEETLSSMGTPNSLLERLLLERNGLFDDRSLFLVEQMKSYLEDQAQKGIGSFGYFGTTHFEIVWEEVCSKVLGNDRDRSLSSLSVEITLPQKFGYINREETSLKDLIEKPRWMIGSEQRQSELYAGGKLNPDILALRKSHDEVVFHIYDAKYYDIVIEETKIANHPGVEDIVKQHAYQATFGDICELNSFKMANAFLFPHEGSTVIYSGSVSYGPLLDFGLNKFEPIDIYLLPAKVMYRNYIAGKQVDLDALPVQTVTYQIVSA